MSTGKKTLVIVGGGPAATQAATQLEASLGRLQDYEIVLISGKEYFYHLVAGLRANVSGEDIAEQIVVPYDKLFKNKNISKIISKNVREVKADKVILEDGQEIHFDYAVIATGKVWMPPSDLPASRTAAIQRMKEYRGKVENAKNILIIGGGAVGVEIAGEIAESYPASAGKTVTLVHSQDKLMRSIYTDKFRLGLQQQLEALGVQVILGDSISGDYDFVTNPRSLTSKNGKVFNNVDLVIQATGGKINAEILQGLVPQLISDSGIKVKPTFQIEGHDNIFVAGDLANLPEQKQVAKIAGHVSIINKNILALINGKALTTYKAPAEMIVVSVGKKGGMGQMTLPLIGTVNPGAWFASTIKSKSLFIAPTRAALGY